jgi:hypothetical protein
MEIFEASHCTHNFQIQNFFIKDAQMFEQFASAHSVIYFSSDVFHSCNLIQKAKYLKLPLYAVAIRQTPQYFSILNFDQKHINS